MEGLQVHDKDAESHEKCEQTSEATRLNWNQCSLIVTHAVAVVRYGQTRCLLRCGSNLETFLKRFVRS